MSGQDWSILITPAQTQGGPAIYTPDLQGEPTGAPLQVGQADIVSWNNRTAEEHQPWPLDTSGNKMSEADAKANGVYLSDPIPAWTPSSPGWVSPSPVTISATAPAALAGNATLTVNYTCAFHPGEKGTLIIWPV